MRSSKRFPGRITATLGAALFCCAVGSVPAQVVRQVTDLLRTSTSLGGLDDAGAAVYALSTTDPYGTNPDHDVQLFRWDPGTGAGEQITSIAGGLLPSQYGPSVSDDGGRIAFVSAADPTGGNTDRSVELFVIGSDGAGLLQLTDTASPSDGDVGHFAMSGNGARLVFESNADYLGTNPSRVGQLWVVETDGTGLRQITTHTLDYMWFQWPSISDDGNRIVFISGDGVVGATPWQVFAILHDGTGRRQVTASDYLHPSLPVISGDGSTIAFESQSPTLDPPPGGCWGSPGQQIAAVNWDGSDLHHVTGVCLGAVYAGTAQVPDLTDDGQIVFYAANEFGYWRIERVNRDGSGRALLTDLSGGPGPYPRCWASRASGAGGRVAFWCDSGEGWGGSNLDLSNELYAMTGTGTDHRQLSSDVDGASRDPDLTPDGAWMVFASDANPLEEPGRWHDQLYRTAPDGSGLTRITSFDHGEVKEPSVTDDGSLVVFAHDGNPLGSNGYVSFEVFAVAADGSGLRQLTPDVEGSYDPSEAPEISGDGSVVVLHSNSDLLREGLGGWHVYRVNPDGTGLARLSAATPSQGEPPNPRVDATGTWVVYAWDGQIHRHGTDGTGDQVITTAGGAEWPDVSPGGGRVVYVASADPLGLNPENNRELFLWEATGGTTTQLTSTASGRNTAPAFDRTATWVYFWSDAPHFGEDGLLSQFRVEVATGAVERVGGLASCVADAEPDRPRPMAVSGDGTLAVFASRYDCAGINPEGGWEVVLVDRISAPRIRVSPGSTPTVVSWDVESGPVRYDVVRGDLASLALVGDGVDLGAVACLEDDSTDASTAGHEDTAVPAPGHGFFYLYRGTPGVDAGPGSYGTGSAAAERLPTAGDCP